MSSAFQNWSHFWEKLDVIDQADVFLKIFLNVTVLLCVVMFTCWISEAK